MEKIIDFNERKKKQDQIKEQQEVSDKADDIMREIAFILDELIGKLLEIDVSKLQLDLEEGTMQIEYFTEKEEE